MCVPLCSPLLICIFLPLVLDMSHPPPDLGLGGEQHGGSDAQAAANQPQAGAATSSSVHPATSVLGIFPPGSQALLQAHQAPPFESSAAASAGAPAQSANLEHKYDSPSPGSSLQVPYPRNRHPSASDPLYEFVPTSFTEDELRVFETEFPSEARPTFGTTNLLGALRQENCTLDPYVRHSNPKVEQSRRFYGYRWHQHWMLQQLEKTQREAIANTPPPVFTPPTGFVIPDFYLPGVDPPPGLTDLHALRRCYTDARYRVLLEDFRVWCYGVHIPNEMPVFFAYLRYRAQGLEFPNDPRVIRDRNVLLTLHEQIKAARRAALQPSSNRRPASSLPPADPRTSSAARPSLGQTAPFYPTDPRVSSAVRPNPGQAAPSYPAPPVQRMPPVGNWQIPRNQHVQFAVPPPLHPRLPSALSVSSATAAATAAAAANAAAATASAQARQQAQANQRQMEMDLRVNDADTGYYPPATSSGRDYRLSFSTPDPMSAAAYLEQHRRRVNAPEPRTSELTHQPNDVSSVGEGDEKAAEQERRENPGFYAEEEDGMSPEEALAHTSWAAAHQQHYSPIIPEPGPVQSPPLPTTAAAASAANSPPTGTSSSQAESPPDIAAADPLARPLSRASDVAAPDPVARPSSRASVGSQRSNSSATTFGYLDRAIARVERSHAEKAATKAAAENKSARQVRPSIRTPSDPDPPLAYRLPPLPAPLNQLPRTFKVRMIRAHRGHDTPAFTLNDGSGASFQVFHYQKNSQVAPQDFTKHFAEQMALGDVLLEKWPGFFQRCMAQQELADLVEDTIQSFSEHMNWRGRIEQLFTAFHAAASPSVQDQRQAKRLHMDILKSPVETLDDFYERYLVSLRLAFPSRMAFCAEEVDEVTRALESDMSNLVSRAHLVFAREDEEVRQGHYPVYNRLEFQQELNILYVSRDPQQEQAANVTRLAEEDERKRRNGKVKNDLRHLSNGHRYIPPSIHQRANLPINGDPYTPPDRPEEVQESLEKLKRREKRVASMADRSNTPSPQRKSSSSHSSKKKPSRAASASQRSSTQVRKVSHRRAKRPRERPEQQPDSSSSSSSDSDDEDSRTQYVNNVGRPVCIGCCLTGHVEKDCPRRDKNHKSAKFLGTGPSPYAKPEDVLYINKTFNKNYSLADLRSQNGDAQKEKKVKFEEKTASASSPTLHPQRSILKKTSQARRITRSTTRSEGRNFAVNRVGENGKEEILLPLNLGGIEIPDALVDTGATCTLISEDLYLAHKKTWGRLQAGSREPVDGPDRRPLAVRGTISLRMCISDPEDVEITYSLRIQVVVACNLGNNMLLGMNVLNQLFSHLMFQSGQLYIRPDLVPDQITHAIAARPDLRTDLRIRKHVELPPGSTRAADVEFDHLIATGPSDPLLLLPKPCYDRDGLPLDLAFPSAVISLEICPIKGRWRMAISNTTSTRLVLPRGTDIGWVAIQPRGLPSERSMQEQTLPVSSFQLSRSPADDGAATYEVVRKIQTQEGGTSNTATSSAPKSHASAQSGDDSASSSAASSRPMEIDSAPAPGPSPSAPSSSATEDKQE